MGKFSGVLLASDLDGTLTNDQGIITDAVKQALAYFQAEGGLFTVCTGRTYMGFHKYDPSYINAPVLLCNGAMAYDYAKEEVVFSNAIGKEGIACIDALMREFPDVAIEMYPFDKTFAIHINPDSERHFTNQDIPFTVIDHPAQAAFPWVKAMLCAKEKTLAVQDFLREKNFPGITFLPTTGSFIELLKIGADKGTGLLQLAECLGLDKKDVYAVGDDYNDKEMLIAAQKAFVPSNGKAETKQLADHIVRSNNDGCVANVIEILDKLY